MTEGLSPKARDLMALMDAQEAAQRARVVETVAEIGGPTGTSAKWGPVIDAWATLTEEARTRDLNQSEKRNREMAKRAVELAFGDGGLINVLQTYYGRPAFEKRQTLKNGSQPQTPSTSGQTL